MNSFDNKRNYTFTLQDLLWSLLEKWKCILLVMLVFIILFSAFMNRQALTNKEAADNNNAALLEKTTEEIMEGLSSNDADAVLSAYQLKCAKDRATDYIKNAAIGKIDAFNCREIIVSFSLVNEEDAGSVIDAFDVKLHSKDVIDQIIEKNDLTISHSDLHDLMYLVKPENEEQQDITIIVALTDEMDEVAMQKTIEETADSITKDLSLIYGTINIKRLISDIRTVSDSEIAKRQDALFRKFSDYDSQISAIIARFTPEQKAAYNTMIEKSLLEKESQNEKSNVQTQKPNDARTSLFSKKNILMGMILGMLVYILAAFLGLLLTKRVIGRDSMEHSYHLAKLGEWYCNDKSSNGIGAFIFKDALVKQIRHKDSFDRSNSIECAVLSIMRKCDEIDAKSIVLIDSDGQGESAGHRNYINDLISSIKRQNDSIQVDLVLEETCDICESIKSHDCIALIIKEGQTRLNMIDKIIDVANGFNKPIIGYTYLS